MNAANAQHGMKFVPLRNVIVQGGVQSQISAFDGLIAIANDCQKWIGNCGHTDYFLAPIAHRYESDVAI
jgi:hypothetical protein